MIQETISSLISSIFGIAKESRMAESVTFFVYDVLKIIFLLFLMIAVIGYFRTFVSNEKIRKMLSGKRLGMGNVIASVFGAITPFCSCSSIPFFMGFIKAGVPLGVAFSFLVTSPLVNEYVAVIMFATFGWKIAAAYVFFGIAIGVVTGLVLGKMNMEKYIEAEFRTLDYPKDRKYRNPKERLVFGLKEAVKITKSIWLWVIMGVGLGAVLHGFVPANALQNFIAKGGIFSVPLAVLVGIPLYANCAAIIPIAVVLFQKGIPLGTTLAFMMATAALSLPEAVILRRIMKLKLIAVFFAVVAAGIAVIGYLFNILQNYLI